MSSGQKFANTSRHDPYRNFNFKAVFVGKRAIFGTGWSLITPAKALVTHKEYKEGGQLTAPHEIPDTITYEPMIFTRGMSEDISIIDAFSANWSSTLGYINREKYTVTISVLDRNKAFVKSLVLRDAWIAGWESGELDAQGASVLIEGMQLRYTNLEILNGNKSGAILYDKTVSKYLGAL
jgi:phage tail-like protein